MEETPKPVKPTEVEPDRGLPHPPEEFRLELLRRLELLEREISSLDSEETHQMFLDSIDSLRGARRELELRLERAGETEGWQQLRLELIAMWRDYRREFERLAAAWHRRYTARPGQRERGPRW